MKRICLISDRNTYMNRFCHLLAEHDYQIALVCRHQGGLDENQFPPYIKFYQLSSTSFFTKLPELFTIIKDFKPDIIHTHYLAKDCLIPALIFRRKFKYYISIWGSDLNIFSINLVNRVVQNLGLLLCDRFHLLSSYFEGIIQKRFYFIRKDKYSIFSWGVEYAFLKSPRKDEIVQIKRENNLHDDDNIVLSYRNHKDLYNHHTVIKAIPEILKEFPNTKFIFTRGSYENTYLERTLSLVKDLNIEENFIFIKRWLSDTELRALIHIADIHVNIPFKDGLPATLFEIMSTKSVPIIGNLDNYHLFFKDKINGFFLNHLDDHHELAEIIVTVLRDLQYYQKKFYQQNNEYVENYQNWEKQSKLYLDFYK